MNALRGRALRSRSRRQPASPGARRLGRAHSAPSPFEQIRARIDQRVPIERHAEIVREIVVAQGRERGDVEYEREHLLDPPREDVIGEVYWTALGREPSAEERDGLEGYLEAAGDRRKALEDVVQGQLPWVPKKKKAG